MIRLELTENEVNLVLVALLELPAKNSMGLIEKIRAQAIPQLEELAKIQGAESDEEQAEAYCWKKYKIEGDTK